MTQIDPRAMPIVDRHQVMERAMNLSLGSSRQLKPILQQQQSLPFGGRVKGYKRQDKIIYEFSHYDLLYYHYTREGYTWHPLASKTTQAVWIRRTVLIEGVALVFNGGCGDGMEMMKQLWNIDLGLLIFLLAQNKTWEFFMIRLVW